MYPQHTNLSHPTSNPPKPTPNFQPTSTDNSTESSPQSSLPCGQRTPAALTSSSDAPSSQTPHQPKIPTHTQHTSPSPHRQHIKMPLKTNANQSSQSSIVGQDQQCVPKSADGTQVKCSKQQPRQQDECLCFHCNLPGHFPKFPIVQNAEQKDTHRTDAATSHRGPDMRTKLVNPETNRKGMKISHSFQAITISVCSVQEIIRPQIVHDNDEPQPLTVLLVVQVLLYTKMHLAPHTPLFTLIHNHQPHTVNLHCMYRHQFLM